MDCKKGKGNADRRSQQSSVHEGCLRDTGYQRDQPEKIFPVRIRHECICLHERSTDEICCGTALLLEGQHLGDCKVLRLCEPGALCEHLPRILRDEAAGLQAEDKLLRMIFISLITFSHADNVSAEMRKNREMYICCR